MVTSILGEEAIDFSIHGWLRGYAPPGELGSRLTSWSANAIANYLSKRDGGLEPNVPSSDAVIVADVIYPLTERRIKSSLAAFEAGTLDTFSFPLALECGYAFMVDITSIQPESSSRGGVLIVLRGGCVDCSRL